jgi:hypothetical protein
MPTPRDSFSKIRTSAETRVKQALAQTRGRADDAGTAYARASLKRAEITESYFVEQEISVSPSEKLAAKRPTGRVELAVPYDGRDYFTRQARDDVSKGIAGRPQQEGKAVIGHLLLQAYAKTSLRATLDLPDRHGSVPIEVLLGDGAGDGDPDGLDQLSADRRTCVTTYEFAPDDPDVLPASLEIDLFDPDSLDSLDSLDLFRLDLMSEEGRRNVDDVISKLRQQVSFRNDLLLRIVVHLIVPTKPDLRDPRPPKPDLGDPRPIVARMAVGWPTITSLRTLSLHVGNGLAGNGADVTFSEAPVRYNPVKRCLEWEGVRMFARLRKRDDEDVHYESVAMLLSIQHPGELYKQEKLEARAEVEIPGYLLSGLTARLYDATGHLSGLQPKLTTHVHAAATLMLDDAFARRDFSPSQHLFFDEIIPDEMRITDIKSSLEERKFKVWPPGVKPLPGSTGGTVKWFLVARRQEGPDTMDLWIYVEGRHFETVEETTAPGGGKINTTRRQTGDLQVFIRGTLARDSKELTHEMNALQRTLRERYGRVRQRR